MSTSHPFVVGGRYRNRIDEYEVLSIDGSYMNVRYTDGHEQTLTIATQARISQAIADESTPGPITPDDDNGLDTAPVRDLVSVVLRRNFKAPYPEDITDQVCLEIENDPDWLQRYKGLVEHFSSRGKDGKLTVNSSIGWFTKELTGMVNLGVESRSRSTLIQSYSRLGYGASGRAAGRPSAELRSHLSQLEGRILSTLDRGKLFDVRRVIPSQIDVFIHETGHERMIRMNEVEPAWDHLRRAGVMTLSEIRERGFSEASPAYVAALLAEVPGVTHGRETLGDGGRSVVTLRYAATGT